MSENKKRGQRYFPERRNVQGPGLFDRGNRNSLKKKYDQFRTFSLGQTLCQRLSKIRKNEVFKSYFRLLNYDEKMLKPYFLKDILLYNRVLDKIAITNFID